MNAKDINSIQTPYQSKHLSVLKAFFQGHILEIAGKSYRYARKDSTLYTESTEEGEVEYSATVSGLFQKFLSFNQSAPSFAPEHASGFTYMLAAECMDGIMSIIESMTDEEITLAISSMALTSIKAEQRQQRSTCA